MPQTAKPTEAEARQSVLDVANAFYDQLVNDGQSQLSRIQTITGNWQGQTTPVGLNEIRTTNLVGLLNVYTPLMTQALTDLAQADGVDVVVSAGLTNDVMRNIREFIGQTGRYTGGTKRHVTARGFTRGSSINANGVSFLRLNVDRDGNAIDTGNPQKVYVRTEDTGSQDLQHIQIFGEPAGKDNYSLAGSAFTQSNIDLLNETSGRAAANGKQQLDNGALGNGVATTAVTAVTNWALNDAAEWDGNVTNLFGTNLRSLRPNADNAYIQQEVTSVELDNITPYLPFAWAYQSSGNALDGIDILWGDKSEAVVGLTDGAWNLVVPTLDKDLFASNWVGSSVGQLVKFRNNNPNASVHDIAVLGLAKGIRVNGGWAFAIGRDSIATADQVQESDDTLSAAATINHVLPLMYPTLVDAYWPTDTSGGSSLISNLS